MQEHVKIFTGMPIIASRLKTILEQAEIPTILKDEAESGRLAGFGSHSLSAQLFILNTDLEKAKPIIETYKKEIEE
ncbi:MULTISPECIES: putative signal transducing protein [Tenacibaculum]|nr:MULTISPECIES: DUF2007 domain-containing protein [Tenacibaculum]MCH3882806.1 DUF2007 domain-containing protein [Tenacibaculum aquimarinum]MCH3884574.1 DUF2007 domain-containing protein [Tenacibaculum aquimarinum]MDO6600484.1 DUF2007 domain-containing protein [Tenacibaculum sp. 1_MG-2023]